MDAIDVLLNSAFFLLILYLISRMAHHFNNTKNKLNEVDKKLDEIKKTISKED